MPRYRQFPRLDDLEPRATKSPPPLVSAAKIGAALALIGIVGFVVWLWVELPVT